ncbi:MAG: hypothetical protein H0T62_13350 [Parachlamydiaceae bacterium]|nr:hypothetical protein [Parachlamydiaceae bacterium]
MKLFKKNFAFNVIAGIGIFSCTSMEATLNKTSSQSPAPYVPSKKDMQLNANHDHGFWAIQQFNVDLPRNSSFLFLTEQRWGSDYKLFWYQKYELIFTYDLSKRISSYFGLFPKTIFKEFSLGSGCAQISQIRKNTHDEFKWIGLTRPLIQAELKLEWKGWTFGQRLRGEYISYNASHNKSHGTCRYRLTLNFPLKWTELDISPFISNEFFFRANTYSKSNPHGLVGIFHEDRLRIGLKSTFLVDKLTVEAWWQWRPLKQKPGTHPLWFNTYQIGATILLSWAY